MSEQKKYVCFSCLKESTNSKVCSHCGVEIEELDMSASQFVPPVEGVVSISKSVKMDDLLEFVSGAVEHVYSLYHDSFRVVSDDPDNILIECNDIAGSRLVDYLNKEFEQKRIDYKVSFSKTV